MKPELEITLNCWNRHNLWDTSEELTAEYKTWLQKHEWIADTDIGRKENNLLRKKNMTLKDRTFPRDKTLHGRTGLEENNRPWLNNKVLHVHLYRRIADICLSSHHCFYLVSLNTFQVIILFWHICCCFFVKGGNNILLKVHNT